MYYHRQLEPTLRKAAEEFACITLYGARQTGKSTMVRMLFDGIEYVTLDQSRERLLASEDPELFLQSHAVPLVIDEIQKVPELMEAVKIRIDEAKLESVRTGTKTGLMYILTGSNTHEIKGKASETLAGRTAIIEVTSLSESEKRQVEGNDFFPDINVLMNRKGKLAAKNRFEVFTEIYKGGMPEYWINEPDRNTFFESYIPRCGPRSSSTILKLETRWESIHEQQKAGFLFSNHPGLLCSCTLTLPTCPNGLSNHPNCISWIPDYALIFAAGLTQGYWKRRRWPELFLKPMWSARS